ncbi:MAG: hypothetical protein M3O21_04660 [Chloroflexota bacterium]|nr:hypothetical protein [Chloroflexota bacterium]
MNIQRNVLGFALQGMALWRLLLASMLLAFTVLVLVTNDNSSDGDGVALSLIGGFALAAGGIIVGSTLSVISLCLPKADFWHPRWSLLFKPGFVGTLITGFTSFVGWPTSEVIGVWAAYRMVKRRLMREELSQPRA